MKSRLPKWMAWLDIKMRMSSSSPPLPTAKVKTPYADGFTWSQAVSMAGGRSHTNFDDVEKWVTNPYLAHELSVFHTANQ